MASDATPAGSGSPPPRWLVKGFTRLHVLIHRLSGGRLMNEVGGDKVCFVTMTGAKSGKKRTLPLMYVPHGEDVLLVASQGGAPRDPVWAHNLRAHPEVEIVQDGQRRQMRAREARPEEKPALWPVCDQHYAPYAEYRTRTPRDIPIFICEPR